MTGFSSHNLKYMRAFAEAWPEAEFVQAVLAQLPCYHQLRLPENCQWRRTMCKAARYRTAFEAHGEEKLTGATRG